MDLAVGVCTIRQLRGDVIPMSCLVLDCLVSDPTPMRRRVGFVALAAALSLACGGGHPKKPIADDPDEPMMMGSSQADAAPMGPANRGGSGGGLGGRSGNGGTGGSGGIAVRTDGPVTTNPAVDAPVIIPRSGDDMRAPIVPPRDGGADLVIATDTRVVTADARPDAAPINLMRGAACTVNGQCRSGNCVGGVCCNDACMGICLACVKTKTAEPDGTCAPNHEMDKKPCGKACVQLFANVPGVVESVCMAGQCRVPESPKEVERCYDEDPCTANSCDSNDGQAKCVTVSACGPGACCCRNAAGLRMCMKQDQCKTPAACTP